MDKTLQWALMLGVGALHAYLGWRLAGIQLDFFLSANDGRRFAEFDELTRWYKIGDLVKASAIFSIVQGVSVVVTREYIYMPSWPGIFLGLIIPFGLPALMLMTIFGAVGLFLPVTWILIGVALATSLPALVMMFLMMEDPVHFW